jgi:hypothetical protein
MAPPKRLVSGTIPEQLTEDARLEQRKDRYDKISHSPIKRVVWTVWSEIPPPVHPAQVRQAQECGQRPQRRGGGGVRHTSGLALRQVRQGRLVVQLDAGQPLFQIVASLDAIL